MYSNAVGYKDSIYRWKYCDSLTYPNLRCLECSRLLDSICLNMASKEAGWFRGCGIEIREHDGHGFISYCMNDNTLGVRIST